jgi:hypothetical protein
MSASDVIALKRPAPAEELSADMARADLIEVLQHLHFTGGHCVLRIDRGVRDYLVHMLRGW